MVNICVIFDSFILSFCNHYLIESVYNFLESQYRLAFRVPAFLSSPRPCAPQQGYLITCIIYNKKSRLRHYNLDFSLVKYCSDQSFYRPERKLLEDVNSFPGLRAEPSVRSFLSRRLIAPVSSIQGNFLNI